MARRCGGLRSSSRDRGRGRHRIPGGGPGARHAPPSTSRSTPPRCSARWSGSTPNGRPPREPPLARPVAPVSSWSTTTRPGRQPPRAPGGRGLRRAIAGDLRGGARPRRGRLRRRARRPARCPTATAPRWRRELKEASPDGEVVLLTGYATLGVGGGRGEGRRVRLPREAAAPPRSSLLTLEQAMRQVRLHAEKRELARRAADGREAGGGRHHDRRPLPRDPQPAQRRGAPAGGARAARAASSPPASRLRSSSRCTWCATRSGGSTTSSRTSSSSPGPASSSPKPVDVGPVLDRVLDAARAGRPTSGTSASCGTSRCPAVAGDEERLRQVVVNLALNALDAVRERGSVRVSCRPSTIDPEFVEILDRRQWPRRSPGDRASASSSPSSPRRRRDRAWACPSSTPS